MAKVGIYENEESARYFLENMRYDPETGFLWWMKGGGAGCRRVLDHPVGYPSSSGYQRVHCSINGKVSHFFNHRISWLLVKGQWPKSFLDHIDGNRTNNLIENLREVDHKQNGANRRKQTSQTTSAYKGVHWSKTKNKWRAAIKFKNQSFYLGAFDTELEAAKAYNESAIEFFGEYALLNNIQEVSHD